MSERRPRAQASDVRVSGFDSAEIRDYYEDNTPEFLRRGEGGSEGAIRRAVWRDASTDRHAAFHYVDVCLLEELTELGVTKPAGRALRFIDLGCGVGASLSYLLVRSDGDGFGLSISPTQVSMARRRLASFGSRARVDLGDFCREALPDELDLAFGIESFVQASEPERLFDSLSRSIRVGGRLALCDDFLAADVPEEGQRWIREFRTGWRLSSLMTRKKSDELANEHGFRLRRDEDWTRFLSLDRPRDYALHCLVAMARPVSGWPLVRTGWNGSRWGNYRGGNALRRSLKQGWVEYRFRVWERM